MWRHFPYRKTRETNRSPSWVREANLIRLPFQLTVDYIKSHIQTYIYMLKTKAGGGRKRWREKEEHRRASAAGQLSVASQQLNDTRRWEQMAL